MIDTESAVSLAIGLGSIGVGMLGLASAHAYRTMRSPKEMNDDLADQVEQLRTSHTQLAISNATLATEVRHLGENVGRLAVEVKGLRDSQWTPPKPRR